MEVSDIRIVESPSGEDRVRLCATVSYERGSPSVEDYWFDVSRPYVVDLSETGNPWLACMLPAATALGERLRVGRPVDEPLAVNAERLLRIWRTWYPELSGVTLDLDVARTTGPAQPGRGGAFFSGGVDSLFTVLRDRRTAPPAERRPIDDLITVLGFDIPLEKKDAFERLRERHAGVAGRLGLQLIDVASNLRETRWSEAQWSYLAHGAGLAAVALSLEKRFTSVCIAGGGGYRGLHPWGSHSVTDPLFSTWRTDIVYDGVAWLRTEKIEAIAQSRIALDALHVCYETCTDENCGACNKCLRTMVALDVCGVLDECTLFPRRVDLVEAIARMDCSHFADQRELEDIRRLALERGRPDVVRAIDRSMRLTRWRQRVRDGRRRLSGPVRALASRFGKGGE